MRKAFCILASLLVVLLFNFSFQTATAKNEEPKLKVFVHYPKAPGKPVANDICAPTANDQVSDYGLTGWHMPTAGMTYKINYKTLPASLAPTQVQSAVGNAFAAWTAADAKQIFTYGGSTSARTAKYDRTNAVLWKPVSSSAIAITYTWYYVSTGVVAESDTVFNKSLPWSITAASAGDCGGVSGKFDVQNIATHEFGHWIGLDDLYDPTDADLTMYGYGETKELKKDSLGAGDVLGVNSILP